MTDVRTKPAFEYGPLDGPNPQHGARARRPDGNIIFDTSLPDGGISGGLSTVASLEGLLIPAIPTTVATTGTTLAELTFTLGATANRMMVLLNGVGEADAGVGNDVVLYINLGLWDGFSWGHYATFSNGRMWLVAGRTHTNLTAAEFHNNGWDGEDDYPAGDYKMSLSGSSAGAGDAQLNSLGGDFRVLVG